MTHANISLFGHDARVHDGTTKLRGSFHQTNTGILNLLAVGIDVSCSVVVNQRNFQTLEAYMDHVWGLGVRRMLMMGIKPFGGAFTERERVFYDFEEGAPYVNRAIRYGVEMGMDITTMGFPSEHFDTTGTRDDNVRALKYFDYVLRRMGGDPYCHDILCDSCFGRDVCPLGAAEGALIVCKCVTVREGALRDAIRLGAHTVKALQKATEACTECRTCAGDLHALIRSELDGNAFNPLSLPAPGTGRHGGTVGSEGGA